VELSKATREADDAALWGTVKDVVRHFANPENTAARIQLYKDAAEDRIAGELVEPMIEVLSDDFGFTEADRKGILAAFIQGDEQLHKHDTNLTRYGILNAVTAHAKTVDSYDRAHELEVVGGKLLTLGARGWETRVARSRKLAEAA